MARLETTATELSSGPKNMLKKHTKKARENSIK